MPALQVPSYSGDPTSTVSITNAYAKVLKFTLDNEKETIDFTVGYYRSVTEYTKHLNPVSRVSYHITPNIEKRADGASLPSFTQTNAMAITASSDPVGTLAMSIVDRTILNFLLTLPEFTGSTVIT